MKKRIVTFFWSEISTSIGPAIHFVELWNNFYDRFADKFSVLGVIGYTEGNEPYEKIKFPLVKVGMLNVKRIRYLLLDLSFAFKLIRYRKDIVYLRLTIFHFFTGLVVRFFKIKPILELNGIVEKDLATMGLPGLFNKLSIWHANYLITHALGCIAVSEGIKEDALRKGAKNVIAVKNGVSLKFFQQPQKPSGGPLRMIYVGTFTPFDGAENIIELAKHFPQVEFSMYGAGDNRLRDKLKASAPANVFFYGFIEHDKLPAIYSQHDAGMALYIRKRNDMVISSLKTLEYVASGLPIFSANVPGQEYIADNGLGMTIEIEDMIPAFENFLSNLPAYKSNAERFRQKEMENLSWIRVAKQTELFISNLVS